MLNCGYAVRCSPLSAQRSLLPATSWSTAEGVRRLHPELARKPICYTGYRVYPDGLLRIGSELDSLLAGDPLRV